MLHTRVSSTVARRWVRPLTLLSILSLAGHATADLAPPPGRNDPLAGPSVPSAAAEVTGGSIDKEVIRRVIRRHINEVRFCYEKGLAQNPSLAGTVAISFRVATSGAVDKSEVKSSTLKHPEVESCIAKQVQRWVFPAPIGGPVTITYPFVLRSAQDPPGSPTPPPTEAQPAKPQPAASPPAGSAVWFSFSPYPGARLLCHEHVRGAGPRPMEIEWALFAVADPVAAVVSHFERESSARASSDGERGGLGLTSARSPRDKMSIFAKEKAAAYPGCASHARAGERTLILVSRGIGG